MKMSSKQSMTSNDKSSSGGDDALSLETGTGSVVTHGVATDTFTRSIPTHIIPYYVRHTLFQAWPGMSGRRLNLQATTLPWYSYDASATGANAVQDSVAGRLVVTTQEAEQWGNGNQSNSFALYADMPFNPASVARWSFWRFDPIASELDPAMALEPQAYALDAFSQLFTESASFHFGYLADIDKEYHRLRAIGPLGRFDDASSEYEAWYRLYHYWRDELETAYLGPNGLVRLPQHLRDGNWTIQDVLDELYAMMMDGSGNFLTDIVITAKGYNRGLSGITLGVQDDAAYHDSDGNVRFYHPYMQSGSTTNVVNRARSAIIQNERSTSDTDRYWVGAQNFNAAADPQTQSAVSAHQSIPYVDGIWDFYAEDSNVDYLSQDGWQYHVNSVFTSQTLHGQPQVGPYGSFFSRTLTAGVLDDFLTIRDLPRNGTLGSRRYWSGHTLNFAQMILFAREIGQAIEPQVLETLIYPMGVISDPANFVRKPAGATLRHMDELYNLYESTSSFNENPARTYTAAHLGPTSHVLPQGQLTLRGMPITTLQSGVAVTARERYWSPSLIGNSTASQIASAFFPGTVLDVSMFRRLDIEELAAFDNPALRALVSRMLGNVPSMRTKIERPVYLPAGKSGPEATYASGLGMGAHQMVLEMVNALAGAAPRYGLGHGGFTDVAGTVSQDGEHMVTFINRLAANEASDEMMNVFIGRSGMSEDAHLASTLLPQGSLDVDEFTLDGPGLSPVWGQGPVANRPASFTSSFGDQQAAGYSGDMDMDLYEATFARGIFGGLRTPMHTVRHEALSMPFQMSWGNVVSNSNVAFLAPANTCYVPGPNNTRDRATYRSYEYPVSLTFTRTVDGATSTFVVPCKPNGHTSTSAYDLLSYSPGAPGNPILNVGDTIHGWVRKYPAHGLGPETNVRFLTSNGAWRSQFTALLGEAPNTDAAANIISYVPDMSITELISQAFAAGCVLNENTSGWSNDLKDYDSVEVNMAHSVGIQQGFFGQTLAAAPQPDGTIAAFDFVGGSGPIRPLGTYAHSFTFRDATAGELAISRAEFNVQSTHTSTGMSPLQTQLEIIHEDGVAAVYAGSGGHAPPGYSNVPGYNNRLSLTTQNVLGVHGASIFGLSPSNPRTQLGGSWSTPISVLTISEEPKMFTVGTAASGLESNLPAATANNTLAAPWARLSMPNMDALQRFALPATSSQASAWIEDWSDQTLGYRYALRPDATSCLRMQSMANHEMATQLTYVYPDVPEYKMTYRPFRVIADASILKELRMIFANDGEDVSFMGGPLGIKVIGTPGQFRFADLLDAGQPETFLLEMATSKTRLISPSFRSVLTFTKVACIDPQKQRHSIPDAVDELNQGLMSKGVMHKGDYRGSPVLTREVIRDVQLGRQFQRF